MYRSRVRNRFLILPFAILLFASLAAVAQTSEFTYQGKLTDNAVSPTTNYDFQFALFDLASGGTQAGTTLSKPSVAVANGIFTVSLDFGNQFPGAARFLEIRVRLTGSGGGYTTLTPRQQVNSQPYSVKSLNADAATSLNCAACVTAAQIASVNGASITGPIAVASVPSGSTNYIQNGTTQQTANQNISGNAFFGGQVGIGTTTPSANVKLQVDAGTNYGIQATSTNDSAVSGVSTNGYGLYGQSATSNAIVGFSSGSNSTSGVYGSYDGTSPGGVGVTGSSSTVGNGVIGSAGSGRGVWGKSVSGTGVFGQSTSGLAGDFAGRVNVSGQVSIGGANSSSTQLFVFANGGEAIYGINGSSSGTGVIGQSLSVGDGVRGVSSSGFGVVGETTSGLAGYFMGPLTTKGNVGIGFSGGAIAPDRLTVQTTTSNYGLVHTDGTISVGSFVGGSNGGGWYGTKSNHPLSLFAGGSGAVLTVTTGGSVGVGTLTPQAKFEAIGGTGTLPAIHGVNQTSNGNGVIGEAGGGTGTGVYGVSTSSTGYGVVGRNLSGGYAGYFDGPLLAGSFLDVNQFPGGGATAVCRNGVRISTCSSSLRYKTNIGRFSDGLSVLNKLNPITFDWKSGGMRDLGFGAEDVAKAEPLLVTYNEKGEVEGVKYDRISAVLVNAVKEQQAQITAQQKQIDQLLIANTAMDTRLRALERRNTKKRGSSRR